MRYTFGPVHSRRFGLSLGIDLSPEHKSCNFDCLYCELDPAKPTDRIDDPPKVEAIVAEVRQQLKRFNEIEVLTITANGEPTLYPYLAELVEALIQIKGEHKLLILSNGSTIADPTIQETLRKLDIVKLSLDCATERCFKRLDRPKSGLLLEQILQGMRQFRKIFRALLVIEILVVEGLNDTLEEFAALNEYLQLIQPDRVDLGTIDRPPAYDVQPISYERLFELSQALEGIPVSIVSRTTQTGTPLTLTTDEIIHLLRRRPLSDADVKSLFDKATQHHFKRLLDQGTIIKREVGNVAFYEAKHLDN